MSGRKPTPLAALNGLQSTRINRRAVLQSTVAVGAVFLFSGWTKSRQVPADTPDSAMKPGDYVWAPQRAGEGELIMIVSIPDQRVHVYRGGVRIARSTCSTGRPGHSTPTGVFTVLQKDADHVSSTYKGAAMPFMERLTWTGIALHAGNLPGYPASHGCIRMPYDFAKRLYDVSHLGVVVIVANSHSEPAEVVHPALYLPEIAEEEARQAIAKASGKKLPPMQRHEHGHRPSKAIISVADKTMTLFEDGHVVARGPVFIKDPDIPVGNHVLVLKVGGHGTDDFRWTAVSFDHSDAGKQHGQIEAKVIDRLSTNRETADALHQLMHPGFTMVITDMSAGDETRSGRDFVIATHHEPEGWQPRVIRQ